jgi:hypothetical protein
MERIKLLGWLALAVLVVAMVWQIASAYIGNVELHQDLRDVAANMGVRIGLSAPSTDDDLRGFVIEKARAHDITLQPSEVTVKVTGEGKSATIYLQVDYAPRISLLVFSFPLHLSTSSNP